ncbi:Lysosome-associated membrane glycoprotein 1 [Blomia tropicalis]|nr:Lysosome-associated membrane glycoprotein 1 [Blomia tropicalis]
MGRLFSYIFLLVLVNYGYCGSIIEKFPLRYRNFTRSTSTPNVVTHLNGNDTSGTTSSVHRVTFPISISSTTTTNYTVTTTQTPTSTPTTTTKNGTTSHTSTTTTESPTTPTVPNPTLPPEPVTPSISWNVSYDGMKTGNYCLMASFASRIDITYKNIDKHIVQTGLDVSNNATVNQIQSQCYSEDDQQMLVLNLNTLSNGTFKWTFEKNTTNNDSMIHSIKITVQVNEQLFPGISSKLIGKTLTLSSRNVTLFDTQAGHSYSCVSLVKTNLSKIMLNDDDNDSSIFQSGTMETSHLKLQAFLPSDKKTDNFLPNIVCSNDKSDISSAIPITVGLILLFMVVVVLIAYMIGRTRQKKQNYATM